MCNHFCKDKQQTEIATENSKDQMEIYSASRRPLELAYIIAQSQNHDKRKLSLSLKGYIILHFVSIKH